MKKFYNFMVEKRNFLLAIMLILAIVSACLIPLVGINHDMTKYLPDDSPMKEGIDIMDEEFPGVRDIGGIQVMFKGLDNEEIPSIKLRLSKMNHVDSVMYDSTEKYNKDGYTLFLVNIGEKYGSEDEKSLEKSIKEEFKDYDMVYQHTLATALTIPYWVYIVVVLVLILILFIMCSSFFEPFLFLLTIGIAIVINLGTNLMFGYISDSTFSLSSILQMALSMDYSIILMNRYRQQRDNGLNKIDSMKSAYKDAFPSIISSGLTTVVGLIVLVLMRFKIGIDLGLVMAKGVAVSMICVLTMLPALIVMSDKLIEKTKKKKLPIKTKPIAKFTFKARNILAVCFTAVFVTVICLQGLSTISYAQPRDNRIAEIFPQDNQIIIMYENNDEDKINQLIPQLKEDENITDVVTYSITLGQPLTAEQMTQTIKSQLGADIDQSAVGFLYYTHYKGNEEVSKLTLAQLIETIQNPLLAPFIGEDALTQIEQMLPSLPPEMLNAPKTYVETHQLIQWFIDNQQSIQTVKPEIRKNQVKMLYLFHNYLEDPHPEWTMPIYDFVSCVHDLIISPDFSKFIPEELMLKIIDGYNLVTEGKNHLQSKNHSLMLILSSLPEESKETTEFIHSLNNKISEITTNNFYIIGNSPMNVEMEENFGKDQMLITILSALAIFIIVALTFRSLLIPLMLVLIVQCGVFITVLINALLGQSIYYMSLLIVQCILMGATIDYGIVFTNYYLENRKLYDVKQSLENAFKDSIHTILTSSMVIVFITGIIGFCPADPAITKICLTIAIGTLCVALLIVFVLPGLLACCDKIITRPKKWLKKKSERVATESVNIETDNNDIDNNINVTLPEENIEKEDKEKETESIEEGKSKEEK